jgi:hypothetical protein
VHNGADWPFVPLGVVECLNVRHGIRSNLRHVDGREVPKTTNVPAPTHADGVVSEISSPNPRTHEPTPSLSLSLLGEAPRSSSLSFFLVLSPPSHPHSYQLDGKTLTTPLHVFLSRGERGVGWQRRG